MTKTKRLGYVIATLVGIGIGCVATTAMPPRNAAAQPAPGSWQCFAMDTIYEPATASQWRGAVAVTSGLNQVARHVPAGAIFAQSWNESTSLVCVKY